MDTVLSGFFASYGLSPHQEVTETMREQARRALSLMEASHLADACIETMSTGEARRILIARALVTEPRALTWMNRPPAWTCWLRSGCGEPCAISPGMARPSPGQPPGGGDLPGN